MDLKPDHMHWGRSFLKPPLPVCRLRCRPMTKILRTQDDGVLLLHFVGFALATRTCPGSSFASVLTSMAFSAAPHVSANLIASGRLLFGRNAGFLLWSRQWQALLVLDFR